MLVARVFSVGSLAHRVRVYRRGILLEERIACQKCALEAHNAHRTSVRAPLERTVVNTSLSRTLLSRCHRLQRLGRETAFVKMQCGPLYWRTIGLLIRTLRLSTLRLQSNLWLKKHWFSMGSIPNCFVFILHFNSANFSFIISIRKINSAISLLFLSSIRTVVLVFYWSNKWAICVSDVPHDARKLTTLLLTLLLF